LGACGLLFSDIWSDVYAQAGDGNFSPEGVYGCLARNVPHLPIFIAFVGIYPHAPKPRLAPESAFILRRVGAGAGSRHNGRLLMPGPHDSDFVDFPKCRHINPSSARCIALTTQANAAIAAMNPYFLELVFDRMTGGAYTISGYELAGRVGRVWARAGYPHR
jgi:hypothetical protein